MASMGGGLTLGVVGVDLGQGGQPEALLRIPSLIAGRHWMSAVCLPLG